jgi:hypothetical protein
MASDQQLQAASDALHQRLRNAVLQASKEARDKGDTLCPWVTLIAAIQMLLDIVVVRFKDPHDVIEDFVIDRLRDDLEPLIEQLKRQRRQRGDATTTAQVINIRDTDKPVK